MHTREWLVGPNTSCGTTCFLLTSHHQPPTINVVYPQPLHYAVSFLQPHAVNVTRTQRTRPRFFDTCIHTYIHPPLPPHTHTPHPQLLLARGASPFAQDAKGATPRELLEKRQVRVWVMSSN